ncbi:MAG: ABC transporter ATP-binding protein [Dehalococcoidia bacterium]|nr:MAG: ABC transporter ATP-binding protein [Dehalococcoidia bacterium]
MNNIAIRAENISKLYRIGQFLGYRTLRESLANVALSPFRTSRSGTRHLSGKDNIWALKNVSFEIKEGEVVGIIGRNGAGKSTLLKVLTRITEPTEGYAEIYGRVGSLLEVGTGFHPELTGKENIYLNGAILGMKRNEIDRKFAEIVEFSGVEKFIDTPLKRYSSGMQVRLAFSIAAHLEPEILLVDEVLAVGDVDFQKKCLNKMEELGGGGRTVLFISHNMQAIRGLCSRVILLDQGEAVADGPTEDVMIKYLQPGYETHAERAWDDVEKAPGDDVARLKSVRVRDESGNTIRHIGSQQPVGIELEYYLLRTGQKVTSIIHFFNSQGILLFGSGEFSSLQKHQKTCSKGIIKCVCWIPGNLLTEGSIIINIALASYSPTYLLHAAAREVISFDVVNDSVQDTSWGPTFGWPGVVRPMLKWEVTTVSDSLN